MIHCFIIEYCTCTCTQCTQPEWPWPIQPSIHPYKVNASKYFTFGFPENLKINILLYVDRATCTMDMNIAIAVNSRELCLNRNDMDDDECEQWRLWNQSKESKKEKKKTSSEAFLPILMPVVPKWLNCSRARLLNIK